MSIISDAEVRLANNVVIESTGLSAQAPECKLRNLITLGTGSCFDTSRPTSRIKKVETQVLIGETLTFDSSRSSATNGILEHSFSVNGEVLQKNEGNIFTHTFNQEGIYYVKSKIVDNLGYVSTAQRKITVSAPITNDREAFFKYAVEDGMLELIFIQSIPRDQITSAKFIVNEQEYNLPNFYHLDSIFINDIASGAHDVTLEVTDIYNQVFRYQRKVFVGTNEEMEIIAPVMEFDIIPSAPKEVFIEFRGVFDPAGLFDGLVIDWGDGEVSEHWVPDEGGVKHSYQSTGTYEVNVEFIKAGENGETVKTLTKQVTVTNDEVTAQPPLVNFRYEKQYFAPHVAFNIDLSMSPTGEIVSRTFDYGDGTVYTGNEPIHTHFYDPGTYYATLTVVDEYGMTASQTARVIIAEEGEDFISNLECFDEGGLYVGCDVVALAKDEEIQSIEIDWGDGNTETFEPAFTSWTWDFFDYEYSEPDNYVIQITVTTNFGSYFNSLAYSNLDSSDEPDPIDEVEEPVNLAPVAEFYCFSNIPLFVECIDESYDLDGDGVTRKWIINNETINNTNNKIRYFSKNSTTVHVALTVSDGKDESSSSEMFTTESPGINVSFTCIQDDNEIIKCSNTSSTEYQSIDVDYTWIVNGVESSKENNIEIEVIPSIQEIEVKLIAKQLNFNFNSSFVKNIKVEKMKPDDIKSKGEIVSIIEENTALGQRDVFMFDIIGTTLKEGENGTVLNVSVSLNNTFIQREFLTVQDERLVVKVANIKDGENILKVSGHDINGNFINTEFRYFFGTRDIDLGSELSDNVEVCNSFFSSKCIKVEREGQVLKNIPMGSFILKSNSSGEVFGILKSDNTFILNKSKVVDNELGESSLLESSSWNVLEGNLRKNNSGSLTLVTNNGYFLGDTQFVAREANESIALPYFVNEFREDGIAIIKVTNLRSNVTVFKIITDDNSGDESEVFIDVFKNDSISVQVAILKKEESLVTSIFDKLLGSLVDYSIASSDSDGISLSPLLKDRVIKDFKFYNVVGDERFFYKPLRNLPGGDFPYHYDIKSGLGAKVHRFGVEVLTNNNFSQNLMNVELLFCPVSSFSNEECTRYRLNIESFSDGRGIIQYNDFYPKTEFYKVCLAVTSVVDNSRRDVYCAKNDFGGTLFRSLTAVDSGDYSRYRFGDRDSHLGGDSWFSYSLVNKPTVLNLFFTDGFLFNDSNTSVYTGNHKEKGVLKHGAHDDGNKIDIILKAMSDDYQKDLENVWHTKKMTYTRKILQFLDDNIEHVEKVLLNNSKLTDKSLLTTEEILNDTFSNTVKATCFSDGRRASEVINHINEGHKSWMDVRLFGYGANGSLQDRWGKPVKRFLVNNALEIEFNYIDDFATGKVSTEDDMTFEYFYLYDKEGDLNGVPLSFPTEPNDEFPYYVKNSKIYINGAADIKPDFIEKRFQVIVLATHNKNEYCKSQELNLEMLKFKSIPRAKSINDNSISIKTGMYKILKVPSANIGEQGLTYLYSPVRMHDPQHIGVDYTFSNVQTFNIEGNSFYKNEGSYFDVSGGFVQPPVEMTRTNGDVYDRLSVTNRSLRRFPPSESGAKQDGFIILKNSSSIDQDVSIGTFPASIYPVKGESIYKFNRELQNSNIDYSKNPSLEINIQAFGIDVESGDLLDLREHIGIWENVDSYIDNGYAVGIRDKPTAVEQYFLIMPDEFVSNIRSIKPYVTKYYSNSITYGTYDTRLFKKEVVYGESTFPTNSNRTILPTSWSWQSSGVRFQSSPTIFSDELDGATDSDSNNVDDIYFSIHYDLVPSLTSEVLDQAGYYQLKESNCTNSEYNLDSICRDLDELGY
ncbi:PKD domain-containing protein [Halobacteriovorax sp. ZH5_bin.2]|uniref:PKD domain-containing protein n=1 Tax=unclassified Halobacteriovorax TaxID=2639665 RepID=UPI003715FA95